MVPRKCGGQAAVESQRSWGKVRLDDIKDPVEYVQRAHHREGDVDVLEAWMYMRSRYLKRIERSLWVEINSEKLQHATRWKLKMKPIRNERGGFRLVAQCDSKG